MLEIIMNEYCIQETTVWGDAYKAITPEEVLRCGKKRELLQTSYPFVDHFTIYAFKPSSQRGPTRESQTFLVSYVYVYDEYIGTREAEFIEKVKSIELRFYKECCLFRGKNAYRILLLDKDVHFESIQGILEVPN